jgi:hypothetical protein
MAILIANQNDRSSLAMTSPFEPRGSNTDKSDCADLLVELYDLLEGYAPMWYTEQIHERLAESIKRFGRH